MHCDNTISSEGIKSFITSDKPFTIEVFDSITSTNSFLMKNFKEFPEFSLITAKKQTGGRGRLGRKFYSPENSGVYFSILLKPHLTAEEVLLITPMAAVAVCHAIEKISDKKPSIKWVNDIFADEKKVCGILTESSVNAKTSEIECVIVGVGINLFEPEAGFPDEISNIAGTISAKNIKDVKNQVIAEFINYFFHYYDKISERNFINEYRKLCFVLGKRIEFEKNGTIYSGTAVDIDNNCRLKVKFDNGKTEFLSSGEISIQIKNK